jgi:hypothetical protein
MSVKFSTIKGPAEVVKNRNSRQPIKECSNVELYLQNVMCTNINMKTEGNTTMYPKVSGLAGWNENCKW